MDCQRILKPIPNCPNCGAPIKGPKCEYCDTIFDDSRIKEDINQLRWEIELRRAALKQAQFSQNIVSAIHAQNAFQQTNLVTSHRDIQFADSYSFLF